MEQRSQEWFEARRGRVTGSVAGAILNLSPFMKQKDVMRAMVRDYHGLPSEFTSNPALGYGTANEETALFEFSFEVTGEVTKCGFFPCDDWLGASPDALVGDDAVAEIKCPFGKKNIADESEFKSIYDLPHYYAQVQIEMLCTGRKKAYFYQWAPNATKLEVVSFDKKWIDKNLPKLRKFYEDFIKNINNPKFLEDAVLQVNTGSLIARAREAKALQDEIKQMQSDLKSRIEALVKEVDERNADFNGIKLRKTERQGSISYASIVKEKLPDLDLEEYRGEPSVSWSLK